MEEEDSGKPADLVPMLSTWRAKALAGRSRRCGVQRAPPAGVTDHSSLIVMLGLSTGASSNQRAVTVFVSV